MRSFTESYLSDTDNTVPFENTTLINQNQEVKTEQSRFSRLIWVVFSNDAVLSLLSVSDKYDSVNERIQEISELTKFCILGVWQTAMKFIRQLAGLLSE